MGVLLNFILSILAIGALIASMRKRKQLMEGQPRSAGRFFARFLLVAGLFSVSGFLTSAATLFLWHNVLGHTSPPTGPAMPFFDLAMPAWLWLTVLGHHLTRGWFAGPGATGWKKGPILACLAAVLLLGAMAATFYAAQSPTGYEAARPTQRTLAPSRNPSARRIENLTDLVSKGQAEIMYVNGNGHSTGSALDAFLLNRTQSERRISIQLAEPLFLRNRGAGQDMLITRVLAEHGRYRESTEHGPFFRIDAGAELVPIVLWGYCVDIDKPNPTGMDELEVGKMPRRLQDVAQLIVEIERISPQLEAGNADEKRMMTMAQILLWQAQGVPDARIRNRLPHDAEYADAARSFLEFLED